MKIVVETDNREAVNVIPDAENYEFDLQSELDRKVAETCGLLEDQHKRGEITDHGLKVALLALDMATRGLIDEEVTLWSDLKMGELSKKPSFETRLFADHKNLFVVSRKIGGSNVSLIKGTVSKPPARRSFEDSTDSVDAASKGMTAICNQLKTKGLREVRNA